MTGGAPGIDLHLHSAASDGLHPPGEVARRAGRAGLGVVALVDHDETRGTSELLAAAPAGLRCVPAIELTVRVTPGPLGSIHLLGYGIDPACPALLEVARRNRLGKRAQIEAILRELARNERIEIAWDEIAGGRGDAYVGRNHIAEVLVRRGHSRDRRKAFRRYLEARRVPEVEVVSAADGAQAIRAAGGLLVLAHPTHHDLDRHLRPLLALGLDGLEVFRPRAAGGLLARAQEAAARHSLLVTGGSDWHGHHPDPPLGTWRAPEGALEPFLERLPLG